MNPYRRHRLGAMQGLFWMVAGIWALGWVAWAQHVEGMAPCELCVWERWPYRALILVGLVWLGVSLAGRDLGRPLVAAVVLVLLAAMAVSGLHVGVEQGWWQSPLPACAAPHFRGGSFAERLASMPLRPAKPCDAPNRLFGWLPVSMTTIDFLYAGALLVCGLRLLPWLIETRGRVR